VHLDIHQLNASYLPLSATVESNAALTTLVFCIGLATSKATSRSLIIFKKLILLFFKEIAIEFAIFEFAIFCRISIHHDCRKGLVRNCVVVKW
jgi:hypothetical protein